MRLGFPLMILGICMGLTAQSDTSLASRKPVDPQRLTCVLRDGKFFSEIGFSKNSEGELTGELGHYVSLPDRGRRFMSGLVFFDIEPLPRQIQGSTGDKRGNISSFKLYPAYKALSGQWIYEQYDGNSAPTPVRFICKYRE